ncbi:hypothetical protein PHMEG_00010271 [Phytophthora megakarya]|uniref:UBX domain-containing protein n=1 Tax=Phytophthora megakarya TaxID=4795 RepID=A0A225WFU2_9STRA|nr:hypothetical protein PHMEG_00010271 [Phytophthora megakarya]
MAVGTTDPDVNGLRRRHVQNDNPAADEAPERTRSASMRRAPRAQKGFVELLMSPLSFVLGDGEPEDPQAAARNFAHSLRRRYGENETPRFEHTSFRDAVSTARTASKFLLVFLHSTIHDDTDVFCRKAMCTERMSAYLNNSDCIVSWAGCVQHAEGFGVSMSLGCAKFPFLALLSCVSRGVNVVEKITANLPADEIIEKLNAAVDRNNQLLATARHIRQQRTEAQILREQQDIEYQESLAADRRREQELREQAEREEKERLQKEEEERLAEKEAQRAEEEKARQEQDYKAEIEIKRARIADGPKARTPPPDHIFYAHDTLKTVRDFIDVEFFDREITIRNFELATNFPKKVYGPELLDVTLAEAGLAPQALVFVQDLDS